MILQNLIPNLERSCRGPVTKQGVHFAMIVKNCAKNQARPYKILLKLVSKTFSITCFDLAKLRTLIGIFYFKKQPINVAHNVTFLTDASKMKDRDDIKCDDLGSWRHMDH